MKHRRDRKSVDQVRENQCRYRAQENASDSINKDGIDRIDGIGEIQSI